MEFRIKYNIRTVWTRLNFMLHFIIFKCFYKSKHTDAFLCEGFTLMEKNLHKRKESTSKSIYLGLGGNVGDTKKVFLQAEEMLQESNVTLIAKSSLYESEPWGFEAKQHFINSVLEVQTALSPLDLFNLCKEIEKSLGREEKKTESYESRIIDIDILYFGNESINLPQLKIPHPKMQLRKFVLLPLSEIAPEDIHSILKKTNQELLLSCEDTSKVNRL